MGLCVSVGHLEKLRKDEEGREWFLETQKKINKILKKKKLPLHEEPEELEPYKLRDAFGTGFSYSYIHYLRRIHAQARQDEKWKATPCSGDPTTDKAVDIELFSRMSSHLICHSDAEGWYVPIDFKLPLFDDAIPGNILGSSIRLLEELTFDAPYLGIKLDKKGKLSDAQAKKLAKIAVDRDDPLYREKLVWLALFEAARVSVEQKTAIVFC